MKTITGIPFSGFYETVHRDHIDRFYEDDQGDISDEKMKKLCDNAKEDEKDYCREYVHCFSKFIGIKLEFESMTSPKEYNFKTDRIFAHIDEADVEELKRKVDHDKMKELVKRKFTSYDGFRSFYDNNYDNWLKQEEPFDHNQIETLIECYASQIDEDWEMEITEDTMGNV